MQIFLSLISGIIGALIGSWLAFGFELRRERNDARYPVWEWFESREPNEGENLPTFENEFGPKLRKYKSTVTAKEWSKYLKHSESIRKINALFTEKERDIYGQDSRNGEPPAQDDLKKIESHWNKIIHITRHRLLP